MEVESAWPDVVERIADGLKSDAWTLDQAIVVVVAPERRLESGWPTHLLGARIDGPDFDGEVGIWAVGYRADDYFGFLYAINETAIEYSSWGEAAGPGSPADQLRRRLDAYPEALAVREHLST